MDRDGGAGLVGLGLVALTGTCAMAVYRAASAGDIGSISFVSVGYGALLLLFSRLRAYERALPDAAAERERLKRQIWTLCTVLTTLFAWKVAGVMPWAPAAVAVWVLAAITSVGGFITLFHVHP